MRTFKENNPEVNLPANLTIEIESEDFPPLVNSIKSPIRENREYDNHSWAQVVSKDMGVDNMNKVSNDRSILECERS